MGKFAIMRMNKIKMGGVGRIEGHHERKKEKYKSNPDINLSRTELNYHLCQPEEPYRRAVIRRIEESGAKRRENSVVMQDCIVTASPEWINELNHQMQMEYFETAYEYFTETFGEENMISAVVHMDEKTPHMHICFVPITKDNRLSSKELIGGPSGLRKHQDNFYEHVIKKFPDLHRGIPKEITHRRHVPTYVYKNAAVLMEHYEEIVNAVNDIGLINNSKKKDQAIELIGRYAPEMAKMAASLKITDKYVEELESALKDANKVKNNWRNTAYDYEKQIEEHKFEVHKLNRDIKRLNQVISKIPPEVLKKMEKDEKERRRHGREER